MQIEIKKIGWRRIGIAVSIVWLIGFAWVLWPREDDEEFYNEQLRLCKTMWHVDSGQSEDIDKKQEHDKRQAHNWSEYVKCESHAAALARRETASVKREKRFVLGMDYVIVRFGWLVVWIVIGLVWCVTGIGRWIGRRFT
jgi:hypothetical protein